MRRFLVFAVLALATVAVAVPAALAGNPHFVSVTATRTGNPVAIIRKR